MTFSDYNNSDSRINGYAAEAKLHKAIADGRKTRIAELDNALLAETIETTVAGMRHFRKAELSLLQEYGIQQIQDGIRSFRLSPLAELPQVTLLDYVLGIDALVNYMGHVIAIDITVNPESIGWKHRKKRELNGVYQQLGIDHTLILMITKDFNSQDLEQILGSIVKDKELPNGSKFPADFNHIIEF